VNTYAHEYSGEKMKYTDEATFNFLNDLFSENQLKNTTIFLAGDHGFALMGVYKLLNPNDWKIEKSLIY
jgi:arylsulfatase A-like enzyme